MKNLAPVHIAMIGVAFAGFIWGLYWIPLRALDARGVTGVWAVVLFYAVPTILLTPLYVRRRLALISGGWPLHISGLLAGTALVLYSGALVFTDVVRALVFFYLTPLWSSLLARIVLGERLTALRGVTIALAFAGLLLILRVDAGIDVHLSAGDWMGLVSGIVWAIAAVRIKSDEDGAPIDIMLSYFLWGSVAALALTLLPLGATQTAPDWASIGKTLIWLVPLVLILIIPPAYAVMWGATMISPGLIGILFMTEISAGTVTAAIWAGEPFGLREALGIGLITCAGVVEPIAQLRRAASKTPGG